ncbi:hydrolase [Nostoc minutum NIES-26]|uniref:Hydrolase n=1 Tax=Nostoc minutum NIES-26 TaxID=1844469 RepID=A0A367QDM7_9NOSO|nr:hydrolase [Nostoc minutum NIES-26]
MIQATATPGKTLLTPSNHTLLLIDQQSMMALTTQSHSGIELRTNATIVAKAAKTFQVSTILTTAAAESFAGPMIDETRSVFPDDEVIDRTTMNAWEDERIAEHVNKIGKDKIVLAGLWTSVCISWPALSALDQGFEVYVIADACGDVTIEAHNRGMDRMVQRGAQPITALEYLLELQRDWARTETYQSTTEVSMSHAGGFGIGIIYAETMFGKRVG